MGGTEYLRLAGALSDGSSQQPSSLEQTRLREKPRLSIVHGNAQICYNRIRISSCCQMSPKTPSFLSMSFILIPLFGSRPAEPTRIGRVLPPRRSRQELDRFDVVYCGAAAAIRQLLTESHKYKIK